jgi:dienelactone hydrolase
MNRFLTIVSILLLAAHAPAQDVPSLDATVAALAKLPATVFAPDAPERKLRSAGLQKLREEVNRKDRAAWAQISNTEMWETFRDAKVALLQKSLGDFPPAGTAGQVPVVVTKTIDGDGFRIEKIVYESRPRLIVTANLYVPAEPRGPMPGIVIIHSHHNPKTQGELQDMGMTWARQGCLVLIPDELGHGERREHPFATEKSFPTPYKVGRQDYFFRYNTGVQLHLVGESLIGWMVWDLRRGIDLLLTRPGIDKNKIIVLGSVAGGGDPAGVLAAVDRRVAAVVPFNFGGPQPETKFPLPADADAAFNYMGGGSWESTRNLRLSGRDGFLPWEIVGAAAPRGLIYAHEFAWDENRDPVWKRFQKIYGFYGKTDMLASMHGRGAVTGKPPEATHCNNIGLEHRKGMHPALAKWFDIGTQEYQKRLASDELQCLTQEVIKHFKPRSLHAHAEELTSRHLQSARLERLKLAPPERRRALQKQWTDLLGVAVLRDGKIDNVADGDWLGQYRYKTQVIRHPQEPYLAVPVLWLLPAGNKKDAPAVIAVAQGGKAGFLRNRSEAIARLLQSGVAVCLPDLRGCGEMRTTGAARGRTSSDTAISATEWMHGRTVLGTQVQELLLVLDAARQQGFAAPALWGDSFAPANAADAKLIVPYEIDYQPNIGEPMGGLAALLAALLAPEDAVRAIHVHGGLVSYYSVLTSQFIYVPHDAMVPGVLGVSDLNDVVAVLLPQPVSIEAAIDGRNVLVTGKEFRVAYLLMASTNAKSLTLRDSAASPEVLAGWLATAGKAR